MDPKAHEVIESIEKHVYGLAYLAVELVEALEEDHPDVVYPKE